LAEEKGKMSFIKEILSVQKKDSSDKVDKYWHNKRGEDQKVY